MINGEVWYYKVYESLEYDYAETAFFKTKTKIVTKRKYWLFGEKLQLEVEKDFEDADFKLYFNIENPKYTKSEIRAAINKKIELLNRVDEIKRGEII